MKTPDYYIAENLSPSIARGNLVDVAKVIDEKLHELDAASILVLLYPRIDELESELVDALAIALHVDYYDASLPIDKRRALVKNSTRWHMRKGTKGVVQEMVATVWDGCNVEEWFEYGGEPYYFRVVNITAAHVDEDVIRKVLRAIYATKNERSWLDGLNFLREADSKIYVEAFPSLHKRYVANPAHPDNPNISATIYVNAKPSIHHHIVASPRINTINEARATPRVGGKVGVHKRVTGGVMNNV